MGQQMLTRIARQEEAEDQRRIKRRKRRMAVGGRQVRKGSGSVGVGIRQDDCPTIHRTGRADWLVGWTPLHTGQSRGGSCTDGPLIINN